MGSIDWQREVYRKLDAPFQIYQLAQRCRAVRRDIACANPELASRGADGRVIIQAEICSIQP